MSRRIRGVSIVELLVGLAVIAILTGVGIVLIPQQGFAVNQGQRILASAVQFARFEAIKRNTTVEARLVLGSGNVEIWIDGGASALRSYQLDPQSNRVVVKGVAPNGVVRFNARGVATQPVTRTLRIGIVGNATYDRVLSLSGQGSVRGS